MKIIVIEIAGLNQFCLVLDLNDAPVARDKAFACERAEDSADMNKRKAERISDHDMTDRQVEGVFAGSADDQRAPMQFQQEVGDALSRVEASFADNLLTKERFFLKRGPPQGQSDIVGLGEDIDNIQARNRDH